MKKIITFLSIVLLSSIGWSQEYKLFSIYDNGKIKLKWITENVNQEKKVDVFKKTNGEWVKLNTQVIQASPVITIEELKTEKNQFKSDKSYQDYIEFKNKKEKDANKQAYADYLFGLGSVFDNQLAFHRGIYFEDSKVEKNQKYQYKIVDVNSQKTVAEAFIIASEPKVNIGKISFNQNNQSVNLSWEVDEDFIGYNLYKNGEKVNENLIFPNLQNNQYEVSYVDNNLKSGQYKYQIKGVTFFGTESQFSEEQSVMIKDLTLPSLVKNFEGNYVDGKISFKWTDDSKSTASYNIYKSEDKGKTYQKINQNNIPFDTKTFKVETNPNQVSTLFFQLEIIGKNGNTNKTMPISVFVPDLIAPSKPSDFIGRAEKGKITLSWKANTENDIQGYRIYRGLKNDDKNEMLLLNDTPLKSTSYTDVFPEKAGNKFIYKIAAIDHSFNISETAEAWIQLPDVIAPNAPVLLDAIVENKTLKLEWTPITNDSIVGYDVFKIDNERITKLTERPVLTTIFNVNAEWSNDSQFYVVAIDAANLVSEPSNKISAAKEQLITDVKLEINIESNSRNISLKLIGIQSSEIDEIEVFRKQSGRGFMPIEVDKVNENYLDKTAVQGEIYEYFIQILSKNGEQLTTEVVSINYVN